METLRSEKSRLEDANRTLKQEAAGQSGSHAMTNFADAETRDFSIDRPPSAPSYATQPSSELKGSIGEAPNHSNFSDRSSVGILSKFRNFEFSLKDSKFRKI